jgi:hypothetical protein
LCGFASPPIHTMTKVTAIAAMAFAVAQAESGLGQNPNPSRTLACQLPPDADIGAGDFNARGRYCHGAGVERATSFPFDTASIGRTLSQHSSATRAASSITIRLAATYPRIVPSVPGKLTMREPFANSNLVTEIRF